MRIPLIVYTTSDKPDEPKVECVPDDPADQQLVRENLAAVLGAGSTLRVGLIVVEVPNEAVTPYLFGGLPSPWPVVPGIVAPPTIGGTVTG